MDACCFPAALAWGLVGSLGFGLGMRPVTHGIAWLWLAGEVLIGALELLPPRWDGANAPRREGGA